MVVSTGVKIGVTCLVVGVGVGVAGTCTVNYFKKRKVLVDAEVIKLKEEAKLELEEAK